MCLAANFSDAFSVLVADCRPTATPSGQWHAVAYVRLTQLSRQLLFAGIFAELASCAGPPLGPGACLCMLEASAKLLVSDMLILNLHDGVASKA